MGSVSCPPMDGRIATTSRRRIAAIRSGRWDGDVFVVDTRNFTDNTWISAEGRVSHHSDQLRIVERYRRVDANTLEIDATVEDPEVLTGPWTAPKQTLVLAPFDRILSLNCSGIETQALMDAAAKQTPK